MVKMIVVDDEILVRIGIKSLLMWEKYGFEFVGEASNGEEALSLCASLAPDIVLTDIKMPGMDGIELIKILKKDYPQIHSVILTCLDEIEYVNEAMFIGASGYFTKISLDGEKILKTLLNIREKIEIDRNRMDKENLMQRYIVDNKLLLMQSFLSDLIGHAAKKNLSYFTNPFLSRELFESSNLFCIVRIRDTIFKKKDIKFRTNILNLIKELFNNAISAAVVLPMKNMEYFVIGHINTEKDNETHILTVMRMIAENIKTYSNLSSELFYVSKVRRIFDVSILYSNYLTGILEPIIIIGDDEGMASQSYDEYYRRNEPDLISAIQKGDCDLVHELVKMFLKHAQELDLGIEKIRKTALNILLIYEKELWHAEESLNNFFDEDVIAKVINLETTEELCKSLPDICVFATKAMKNINGKKYRTDINKIISNMQSHYAEKLTMTYSAKLINMSSSYFSRLFKKETGMSYIEYLTKIRIDHAKEFLKNPEYSVQEIAQNTGFEDMNYFSKAFKKNVGMSPSKYRNKKR